MNFILYISKEKKADLLSYIDEKFVEDIVLGKNDNMNNNQIIVNVDQYFISYFHFFLSYLVFKNMKLCDNYIIIEVCMVKVLL